MTEALDRRLADLLEQASAEDRRVVGEWLAARSAADDAPPMLPSDIVGQLAAYKDSRSDEGNQLLKFRLPISSYVRLQGWCDQHDLSMSAALRGLVEILLKRATAL